MKRTERKFRSRKTRKKALRLQQIARTPQHSLAVAKAEPVWPAFVEKTAAMLAGRGSARGG